MKKQPDTQFGTDTATDNVSMPTLNAMQRPTAIVPVGKNIQRRAARLQDRQETRIARDGTILTTHRSLVFE